MLPSWVYELAEKVLMKSIEYPTVLGEAYRDIVEYYAEVLSEYGVHTTIHRVPEDYVKKHLKPSMNPEKPRYILIARIGSGEKTLQYNGHYDVVAPGSGWKVTDPFKPRRVNGRIYGRGSTDMKGGLAAVTAALAYLASTKEPLDHVVEAAYVPDEEIGGLTGTGYLVRELGSRPNWVVIAEPSGPDVMWVGHKGGVWAEVVVKGKQAHGSTPWLGDNAFEKMVYLAKAVIEELKPRIEGRRSRYEYDLPESAKPTITLGGKLGSPGSINIVPGEVSFSIDRRSIVEEDIDEVEKELVEFIEEASRRLNIRSEVRIVSKLPPAFTSPSSDLALKLSEVARSILGREHRRVVCSGGLDLHYYTEAGCKAVSYGPGVLTVAHMVDEYIEIDILHKFIDIYVEFSKKITA